MHGQSVEASNPQLKSEDLPSEVGCAKDRNTASENTAATRPQEAIQGVWRGSWSHDFSRTTDPNRTPESPPASPRASSARPRSSSPQDRTPEMPESAVSDTSDSEMPRAPAPDRLTEQDRPDRASATPTAAHEGKKRKGDSSRERQAEARGGSSSRVWERRNAFSGPSTPAVLTERWLRVDRHQVYPRKFRWRG